MIPKHSNPYLLLTSTTTVSRAALRDDCDEVDPGHSNTEQAQLVAQLENILKRSISEALPATDLDDEGDSGARRKKRNKVDSQVDQKDKQEGSEHIVEAVPFRLLSGMAQPKPIVIVPKPMPIIISEGPALEDTEEQAELRAARAREVAVDLSWIMDEARRADFTPRGSEAKVEHFVAELPSPPSALLLIERPKVPPPKPPRLAHSDSPDIELEPSPHEHDASCCPVVDVQVPPAELTTKRKRRKSKHREKPLIQATFWRPPPGSTGKCLGYAWGYPGSRPLSVGDVQRPRYERDTMKKAEFEAYYC